ncbi:MAG TPA: extracellular solute-binding protein [Nitriliruptorales bacterium]
MERTARVKTWRTPRWLLVVVVLAMFGAACGDSDGGAGTDGGDGGSTDDGGGGGSVSLLHAIGGEGEQAALQAALDIFEQSTGNTVEAEFTDDFATTLGIRIDGNNPPDVAFFPQPGALQGAVDDGAVTSFDDAGVVTAGLAPGVLEAGTFDGTAYGVVVKQALSSLLWYNLPAFEAGDHSPPESWDELLSLTEEISATGTPAWCIGIESGGATGWVATNWIEDVMLRLHGGDVYDQWTTGALAFDSPEVREAFELAGEIFFDEDAVLGGTTGILNTPFGTAAAPMFQDPPACLMHRQAGFIEGSFEGELGTDYGLTLMPPIDGNGGAIFSGDLAAILSDNPVAGELVSFLVSSEAQEAWHGHEGSGSLSVRGDFDASVYPSASLAQQGELLAAQDVARFDGSDLMPSAVGGEAFFTELVAWLNGQDLDTTLANIDAAWPM